MYVIKYIIVNDCFVICVGSSLLSKTVDVTLGKDFLRKHGIWTGWSPTGKVQLISQQKFLVESLEVLMKGPMIHNRQGINIPEEI